MPKADLGLRLTIHRLQPADEFRIPRTWLGSFLASSHRLLSCTMTRTILRPNVPREIVFNPQHHEMFGTLIEAVACSVMLEIFSTEILPTRHRHEIAAYTELQEEHVIEQLIL
ncbi:hypothetical protein B0H14DRAFT_3874048 [Mycena olivaceomarginata]|nr:hypothetical protein B0H14DRAFT_3896194 [Mycena olivaceomarginata]KAJ7826408.1 hypothetical protein B0H14DRAFT_3874048 [Mycena olivaceomarginata]